MHTGLEVRAQSVLAPALGLRCSLARGKPAWRVVFFESLNRAQEIGNPVPLRVAPRVQVSLRVWFVPVIPRTQKYVKERYNTTT